MSDLDWYYLDGIGHEFGPYSNETMREWFNQGFFPIGKDLLVRLSTWKTHKQLWMAYPDISKAFSGPPAKDQQGGQHAGRKPSGPQLPRDFVDDAPPMPPYPMQQQAGGYCMMPGAYGFPPAAGGFSPAHAAAAAAGMGGFGFPSPLPGVGMFPGAGGLGMPPQGMYGMPPFMPPGGPGAGHMPNTRFRGRVKSFNAKQGFGFIECPEAHLVYHRDVFLHKAQIGDLKVGAQVTFIVEFNKQGMPQAREIATLDGSAPGPTPPSVAKGGGPSGSRPKASGVGGQAAGPGRTKRAGRGGGQPGPDDF